MKNKKIINIIAISVVGLLACAILIGILNGLIGKGKWNLGWTDYQYDDSLYRTGEGTIAAPGIEHINLDWIDGNITVVICQDAYISITEKAPTELTEKTTVHWYVSEDGKSLSIKYRASSSFFGRTKDKEKDLILRIPQKLIGQLQTLKVNAVSSNITVSDVLAQNTEVKTESGNIQFEISPNTSFILVHNAKNSSTPTIDFPFIQAGNTYVCGTQGNRIAVDTNNGKLSVISKYN